MKKLIAASVLSCCSAMTHATVFTYQNLGFHDASTGDESDLTISYNDSTDQFSFDLTQEHASKDYDRIWVAFSDDGGSPDADDLKIQAYEHDSLTASPYGSNSYQNVAHSSVDFGYSSAENAYSFSGDLTDQLLRAGNTSGLFGDSIGIWLYGYADHKWHAILDVYNGHTTRSGSHGVSEPSTLLLIPAAFAMLMLSRRRRRA